MGGKDRRRLFWELLLMMVIVTVLTTMMFVMSGKGELLFGGNWIVTLIRMTIILVSGAFLAYFESSNITRSVDIIRKAFNKIKHADLRERIYMDDDNLFADLSVEANAFMDNFDEKLKYIRDGIESVRMEAENKGEHDIAEKCSDLLSMFNDR